MEELDRLHHALQLKGIERSGRVGSRQESTAEHVYGCMVLAEYFIPSVKGIDELKVFRMLLYHDMIEIESGDTFILDEKGRMDKHEREREAARVLSGKLPSRISSSLKELWNEYEEGKTLEARFCLAIDALEPVIHHLEQVDYVIECHFTEEVLRDKKEHKLKEFPGMLKMFNDVIELWKSKGMPTS